MDGALARLLDEKVLQPVLFSVEASYFVKLDNMAVAIEGASCFSEALEFAFMCFWVFNVSYPEELRLFYTFLEKLLGMKSKIKSSLLADVWRSLHQSQGTATPTSG